MSASYTTRQLRIIIIICSKITVQRDTYASAVYAVVVSRVSVRLSQADNVWKRLDGSSWFWHIEASFYILCCVLGKFRYPKIRALPSALTMSQTLDLKKSLYGKSIVLSTKLIRARPSLLTTLAMVDASSLDVHGLLQVRRSYSILTPYPVLLDLLNRACSYSCAAVDKISTDTGL